MMASLTDPHLQIQIRKLDASHILIFFIGQAACKSQVKALNQKDKMQKSQALVHRFIRLSNVSAQSSERFAVKKAFSSRPDLDHLREPLIVYEIFKAVITIDHVT
jgi:hypothetical protein